MRSKGDGREERIEPKIVLLGDRGVDKTALAMRLRGGEWEAPRATLEPNTSDLKTWEGSIVDFPGDISRIEIRHLLEREGPAVALVVFDARKELAELPTYIKGWLQAVPAGSGDKINVKRFLVASMCDTSLFERKKFEDVGRRFGFNGAFFTSAYKGEGIQELREGVLGATKEEEKESAAELIGVAVVVQTMAGTLCELVAKNPHALEEIEWRDLERLVATALEHLGFSVKLTPSAKDGGKDLIATYLVENSAQVFYVEIKHWREGSRPGMKHVSDFIEVNARDGTEGGLFLSSSGYTNAVYSRLSEISRQHIRLGESEKIVSLCQQYVKKKEGVWRPLKPLPDTLFEQTLG